MKKYEFIEYFWSFRARMHYNAELIRNHESHEYYMIQREIKAFADGLSWKPDFSREDYKKFIRIGNKYLEMVANGAINPRFNNYGGINMNNENNMVKAYNLSGKFMYQSSHKTADEAYKEYKKIIENLKNELPNGYKVTVARERYGKVQSMETIIGTK